VTPLMYEYMTRRLSEICPKVLVLQEGGYNVNYLGQHASGVSHGLLGTVDKM
jgi:acetoin utilization deacetylase AcuC-like enzyme